MRSSSRCWSTGSSSTARAGVRARARASRRRRPAPFQPFTGVDLAGANNVIVQVGSRQSVIVHADNNLLKRVTTRVRSGRLVIGTTPGNLSAKSPDVRGGERALPRRPPAPGRRKHHRDRGQQPEPDRALPGSGNIDATGSTTKLDVTISGARNGSAAPAHRARRESCAQWRRQHHAHRDAQSQREGLRQRHGPLWRQPPARHPEGHRERDDQRWISCGRA